MKATKQIFEKANELFAEVGRMAVNDNDVTEVCNEYNALLEAYDFNNALIKDANGLEGVKWCWGGVMIPARYAKVKYYTTFGIPAEDNYAIVSLNGKDILVNGAGDEVFEADELKPNIGGIVPVLFRKGDKWGIAGSKGEIILPALYDSITPDGNGFTILTSDGKIGFMANGHVVEPKFDDIDLCGADYIIVTVDGKQGYVDENDEFTTCEDDAYYSAEMYL